MPQESRSNSSYQRKYEWEESVLPKSEQLVNVNEIVVSALKINGSFKISTFSKEATKELSNQLSFLYNIFKAIGVAISNIDNAPLLLSSIRLKQQVDTRALIFKKIYNHYRDEALQSIFKVIGSINIIGNPVGFFKNIGRGIVNLFYYPMAGFIKGPFSGTKGLALGAYGLFQYTTIGVFKSVESISDSVASVVSYISQDKIYINKRDEIKVKQTNNILYSFGYGMYLLYEGFEKGITGIVYLPYNGAKKFGKFACMVGAVKGLCGVILKPVSGTFDALAKISEGISNFVDRLDEKPNKNRKRLPRIFYDKEQFYKGYSEFETQYWLYLQNLEKRRFHDWILIDIIHISNPFDST